MVPEGPQAVAPVLNMAVDPQGDFPAISLQGEEAWRLGTVDTGIVNAALQDRFRTLGIANKQPASSAGPVTTVGWLSRQRLVD